MSDEIKITFPAMIDDKDAWGIYLTNIEPPLSEIGPHFRIPPATVRVGVCDQCGRKLHISASRCIECARKEFP